MAPVILYSRYMLIKWWLEMKLAGDKVEKFRKKIKSWNKNYKVSKHRYLENMLLVTYTD
jgi:hypothetical protein